MLNNNQERQNESILPTVRMCFFYQVITIINTHTRILLLFSDSYLSYNHQYRKKQLFFQKQK